MRELRVGLLLDYIYCWAWFDHSTESASKGAGILSVSGDRASSPVPGRSQINPSLGHLWDY